MGMSKADVDAMWRHRDDFIFAELEYTKSKTCCWNSTNNAMYQTIVDFNAKREEEAGACLPPVVFKATDGGYDLFRDHNPVGWVDWSEDEPLSPARGHRRHRGRADGDRVLRVAGGDRGVRPAAATKRKRRPKARAVRTPAAARRRAAAAGATTSAKPSATAATTSPRPAADQLP